MPLFGRRNDPGTDPAELDLTGPWSVSEGSYEGRPLIVRRNTGIEGLAGDRRYPLQAGIAVQCNAPDANGFPSEADSAALATLEDELVAAFCGTASTVLAAVLTTAGMREFVFYVSDEKAFREHFRAWAQTPKSHRAQMIVRRDPSWSVYRSFAP